MATLSSFKARIAKARKTRGTIGQSRPSKSSASSNLNAFKKKITEARKTRGTIGQTSSTPTPTPKVEQPVIQTGTEIKTGTELKKSLWERFFGTETPDIFSIEEQAQRMLAEQKTERSRLSQKVENARVKMQEQLRVSRERQARDIAAMTQAVSREGVTTQAGPQITQKFGFEAEQKGLQFQRDIQNAIAENEIKKQDLIKLQEKVKRWFVSGAFEQEMRLRNEIAQTEQRIAQAKTEQIKEMRTVAQDKLNFIQWLEPNAIANMSIDYLSQVLSNAGISPLFANAMRDSALELVEAEEIDVLQKQANYQKTLVEIQNLADKETLKDKFEFKSVDWIPYVFDPITGKAAVVSVDQDWRFKAPLIIDTGNGNVIQDYWQDVSQFNPKDNVLLQNGKKGTPWLDIDGRTGDSISAFNWGTVLQIADVPWYGNQVIILDKDGNEHMYSHLRDLNLPISEWDEISAGELIGFMGNTGTVFGIDKNGELFRPWEWDIETGSHLDYRIKTRKIKNWSRWANPNDFIGKKITVQLSPKEKLKEESKLRKEAQVIDKSATGVKRFVANIDTGIWEFRRQKRIWGDLGAATQTIIFSFNKLLDEGSVVRESEFIRTAEGQSLLNRLTAGIEQLEQGGAGVAISTLESVQDISNKILLNVLKENRWKLQPIQRTIEKAGLEREAVLTLGAIALLDDQFIFSILKPTMSDEELSDVGVGIIKGETIFNNEEIEEANKIFN